MQDLHLGGCLTGGEGLGAWLVSTAGPTNTLNFIAHLEGAQGRMGTVGGVGRQPQLWPPHRPGAAGPWGVGASGP